MNKSKSFINLIKLNSSIKIINRNYSNLNSKVSYKYLKIKKIKIKKQHRIKK